MKTLFVVFLCICLYSKPFAQQTDHFSDQDWQEKVIAGIITENPNDFYKVTDLLRNTKGVKLCDYCFDQKLVSFTFSKEHFGELTEVYDYIKSHFAGAQCYTMKLNKDAYFDICKNELMKQSLN